MSTEHLKDIPQSVRNAITASQDCLSCLDPTIPTTRLVTDLKTRAETLATNFLRACEAMSEEDTHRYQQSLLFEEERKTNLVAAFSNPGVLDRAVTRVEKTREDLTSAKEWLSDKKLRREHERLSMIRTAGPWDTRTDLLALFHDPNSSSADLPEAMREIGLVLKFDRCIDEIGAGDDFDNQQRTKFRTYLAEYWVMYGSRFAARNAGYSIPAGGQSAAFTVECGEKGVERSIKDLADRHLRVMSKMEA